MPLFILRVSLSLCYCLSFTPQYCITALVGEAKLKLQFLGDWKALRFMREWYRTLPDFSMFLTPSYSA
jgi:hypothetical protein